MVREELERLKELLEGDIPAWQTLWDQAKESQLAAGEKPYLPGSYLYQMLRVRTKQLEVVNAMLADEPFKCSTSKYAWW